MEAAAVGCSRPDPDPGSDLDPAADPATDPGSDPAADPGSDPGSDPDFAADSPVPATSFAHKPGLFLFPYPRDNSAMPVYTLLYFLHSLSVKGTYSRSYATQKPFPRDLTKNQERWSW